MDSYRPQDNQSIAPGRQKSHGIDPDDRESMLLDDLRHEIRRLADAVEQQNEHLEELLEADGGLPPDDDER